MLSATHSRVFRLSLTLGVSAASLVACGGGSPEGEVGSANEPIVGGHIAYDHPEVGHLELNNLLECTGTLVGRRVVLAAAHCFKWESQLNAKDAGVFIISKPGDDYPGQQVSYEYHVIRFVSLESVHAVGKNDIAIAQLDEVVPTSVATPYKVGTTYPARGVDAAIYGYGAHTPTGSPSGAQQKYRRDFTWHAAGEAGFNYIDDVTGSGDSGGPLMTAATGIVGVVSCGEAKPPYQDCFGNTVANHPWIHTWAVRWN